PKPQVEDEEYDLQRGITQKLPIIKGKGKGIAANKQVAQSLLELQMPKKTNAETGAQTDKTNSERDTEILNIGEEQEEDVATKVDLEDKTAKIDEGHVGSDPGKTPESRPPPERVPMEEDQVGPNHGQSYVALAGPNPGQSPEPMHDDFVATMFPQGKSSLQLVDEPDEEPQPTPKPQVEDEEYDLQRGITQKLPIIKGKGKGIAANKQVAQSLLELQMPKKTNAETGAQTDKTNSERDTEILNIGEEQEEDVATKVDLEDKTAKIDEGHVGSDPGKTPESRPPPERVPMEEDQVGPNHGQSYVALAGPNPGQSPEPMHDDFVATMFPQVHESLKQPDC
nr:hypothetical protein [Tanacetum cinerariifolium]